MSLAKSASDGCYEAGRVAALSGVPKTTVYWWARQGIVVPSVSSVREKLWSYSALMALRVVSWLRHPKAAGNDFDLPASPMPKVRKALACWTNSASTREAKEPVLGPRCSLTGRARSTSAPAKAC
jgi:hypothetical protein